MAALESYWVYKHAWRGAGSFYQKGDHVPTTRVGPPSLSNALSLVAAWETWCMPRPQPVDPKVIPELGEWNLEKHYPPGFESPTFPKGDNIPIYAARRESTLVGHPDPNQGNLWRLLHNTMGEMSKSYLKYAHAFAVSHSRSPTEYYSWDKFLEDFQNVNPEDLSWSPPGDFDDRFYYYPSYIPLTMDLSRVELQTTTEEAEIAKCQKHMLSDFPNRECRLIPEAAQLGNRGRKRSAIWWVSW